MFNLFQAQGKVETDILYDEEKNPQIVKDILDQIVYYLDRFEVEFVSSNEVKFNQDLSKIFAVRWSNPVFIHIFKGEFALKKNDNGSLTVEYHMDNGLSVYYVWCVVVALIPFIPLVGVISDKPEKSLPAFIFFIAWQVFLLGGSHFFNCFIPSLRFASYIKKALKRS